jgi:alpha-2-macroglobulin
MRKHHMFFLTGLLLALSLLTQCGGRKDKTGIPEPVFHPDISAFTAGVISNGSVITIVLSRDYDGPMEVMAPVAKRLFDFSPSIKGTAYWINARTIEFRPEEKASPRAAVYCQVSSWPFV